MTDNNDYGGSLSVIQGTPAPQAPNNKTVKESALEEALKHIFDSKGIEMKSDLSPQLVLAMARGKSFVRKYKSETMDYFIDSILELSVSKNRKGRAEFVAMIKNSQEVPAGNEGASGWKRLIGNR